MHFTNCSQLHIQQRQDYKSDLCRQTIMSLSCTCDLISNTTLKGWEYWIWMCIFVGTIHPNRKSSLIKKDLGIFVKKKKRYRKIIILCDLISVMSSNRITWWECINNRGMRFVCSLAILREHWFLWGQKRVALKFGL